MRSRSVSRSCPSPVWTAQNRHLSPNSGPRHAPHVSTHLGPIFGASVLDNATPSRETGAVRKLSAPSYASHGPGQAPNDPHSALRASEGRSSVKRRRRPNCCGRSVEPIRACAPDAFVYSNDDVSPITAHKPVRRAASTQCPAAA